MVFIWSNIIIRRLRQIKAIFPAKAQQLIPYIVSLNKINLSPSRVEQRLELSPPLNTLVIEELNQIFFEKWSRGEMEPHLFYGEQKRRRYILKIKKEKAKPQYIVTDLRSSPSYIIKKTIVYLSI